MRRLLSIEFQKIWKNKASRILVLAYFFLLSSIALISSIKFTLFGNEIRIADQGIFNFPYIWHFNTFIAALFKIFLNNKKLSVFSCIIYVINESTKSQL